MPCFTTECDASTEVARVVLSLLTIYSFQLVSDLCIASPLSKWFISKKLMSRKKDEQFRESVWKNLAVTTLFTYALVISYREKWFFSTSGFWEDWPTSPKESLRWYYTLYAAYWLHSIDCLCSITKKYYIIKRKDNLEMLIHHFATLCLILFSYLLDFTRCGLCVLVIHDVNDLLLETAKLFKYLNMQKCCDTTFAIFTVSWYIFRFGIFLKYIILSIYYECYSTLVVRIYEDGGIMGYPPQMWYAAWVTFLSFLSLLLVLHIYWGCLITRMVYKAITAGSVEKDIRSDSDSDDDRSKKKK